MRGFKKISILFLILLLSSGSVFAERKVYDIRVDRENIYNQAQNHRNRLDTKFKSELNSELKQLGSTATKQQKTKVFDKLRAKYMQKHKVLDSAMTRLARGREFNRNELLKKVFKKAKVDFPAFTGTPPGKTGGILTDVDLSTISKKDANKVYDVLKKMFGKANVAMANGTISVANLDTTAFYPMKGGRYAPNTYNNSEYMHYFDKHAPVGNSTSQLNVRKDYVYDNVKKMHSDLTSSPKSLLKDPDKLRNMSKSAFRLHGTTGGGNPVGPSRNAYKDSKKLLATFEKSIVNGKPMKLSTIDKALLISKGKLSAEAVGLYPPGASESEKLTAIRKYRKEIKVIVNDSLEMAQNWDDTIEQQLKRKYSKAVKKGKTTKASTIKKAIMEMRARKVRAKLGIINNGGSDMLAETMGLETGEAKTLIDKTKGRTKANTKVTKTYYDPKTKKYINKAQLRQRIIKDDLQALKELSKMDEAFVAKQHAKNPKRQKLVKTVQSKTVIATNTSKVATDLADDAVVKTKGVFRKSAQKMRIIGKKIAPQLAARAGFGKALGWVGFLAALPQSMKDSEELTKTWISADDTDVTVYAKQFTSLSLHASGAKYMFDMFSNNVENRVLEFKQDNPGAWENMTFQERIEVRKQSFKSAIWKTSGQMGKAIVVDMPKAMVMNTYHAAKQGTGLLGDKLNERSANKRMKKTQNILQQKKTQIAVRSSDAKRDWQSLHKAYEKKHGKATQDYLKNPPKPIGNEQGADYEELLDLTYGQEIANSLDKARQDYKDAIKKAGGRKSGPGVSVALKRISSVTEMMEDYVSDPRNARNSGKAAQRLKEYQASVDKAQKEIEKQQSDAAKSKVKPKSTSKGNGNGIQVTSARYGKSKFCDATGFAKGQCDGKKACSFQVGNNMCGDPEFGVVKELKYTYKCVGGAAVSSTISEYNVAQMECSESEKASSSTDTSSTGASSTGASSTGASSTGASSTGIGPIRMSKSNKVTYKSTSSELDRKYLSYITALQLFRALDDDHEYKAKAKSQLDVKYKIYMDAKRNSK